MERERLLLRFGQIERAQRFDVVQYAIAFGYPKTFRSLTLAQGKPEGSPLA